MQLWQRALVPTAAFYENGGTGDGQDEAVSNAFAEKAHAVYRNRGQAAEVLLMSPSAFVHARAQVEFARDAGLVSQLGFEQELASLEKAKGQVEACRAEIKKLNRQWAQMEKAAAEYPAGGARAAKKQEEFVARLEALDALWLLPNFIAWGEHRGADLDFWRSKGQKILDAAFIDDSNAFIFCANFNYGSFNRRVCAVAVLLSERGKVEPRAAEEILERVRAMGREPGRRMHMGWGMEENGASLSFPDREGLGPMAVAALEAIALRSSMRIEGQGRQENAELSPAAEAGAAQKAPRKRL